jgi:hypothetical protein
VEDASPVEGCPSFTEELTVGKENCDGGGVFRECEREDEEANFRRQTEQWEVLDQSQHRPSSVG